MPGPSWVDRPVGAGEPQGPLKCPSPVRGSTRGQVVTERKYRVPVHGRVVTFQVIREDLLTEDTFTVMLQPATGSYRHNVMSCALQSQAL